jgi:hypothetical protein
MITAGDKDWKPVTDKLFEFAAITVDSAAGLNLYNEKEYEWLRASFGTVRGDNEDEKSLIESVFGVQSKVGYFVFIE